jgi:hypothetical protein
VLVGHLLVPGHHALALAFGVNPLAIDLAFGGEPGGNGVAIAHGFDESQG